MRKSDTKPFSTRVVNSTFGQYSISDQIHKICNNFNDTTYKKSHLYSFTVSMVLEEDVIVSKLQNSIMINIQLSNLVSDKDIIDRPEKENCNDYLSNENSLENDKNDSAKDECNFIIYLLIHA